MSTTQSMLRKDGGWLITTTCGDVSLSSWSLSKPSKAERDALLAAVRS